MKVDIYDTNEGFIKVFLPFMMKNYIKAHYEPKKAKKVNEYLASMNIKYNVKELMLYAIDNLKVYNREVYYTLEVDKNLVVNEFGISLDIVLGLISYGTLTLRRYPLFLDTLKYVKDGIVELKHRYNLLQAYRDIEGR